MKPVSPTTELLKQIERCDQEIASCRAYQADKSNPLKDRQGATMGEVDFWVERELLLAMLKAHKVAA